MIFKKVAISGATRIPKVKRYLEEKGAMQVKIKEQNNTINNLENNKLILEQNVEILEESLSNNKTYKRATKTPKIIIISNQLDASGAPLVLMDVISDYISNYSEKHIEFHSFPPVSEELSTKLKSLKIKPIIHPDLSTRLEFIKGDVVLLNTCGYTTEFKDSVLKGVEQGKISKLIWFMHEDWPEIFFNEDERARISNLLKEDKIFIYIPAIKALNNHEKLYGVGKNMERLPLRINLPEQYHITRSPEEFNKLTFTMVGKTGGGIKGQLPVLYAFLAFKQYFYDINPGKYRDFELRFVALEADYLSLQILNHAKSLQDHFKHYPPLPHDQVLDVVKESNITVCYSIRECLPIFVFEGMLMGHPILRNDVSGLEEQLVEGENGYLVDNDSHNSLVEAIEKILNLKTTSNDQLSSMSKASHKIAAKQSNNSYNSLISLINRVFLTRN